MLAERLTDKIDARGDCWEWTAATGGKGYGYGWCSNDKRMKGAHRLIWELLVGPIPEGLTLDHLCRNKLCVNPDHLEPVTHQVNILRGNASQC